MTHAAGALAPDVHAAAPRPAPPPDLAGISRLAAGQLLVEVRALGLNPASRHVQARSSVEVPACEGAGVVLGVGPECGEFEPGDRVAWVNADAAEVAERSVLRLTIPARDVVKVPEAVDDETAAGLLFDGLTADLLTSVSHPVRHGDVAVVHSAATSTSLMLTQFVVARGASVIAIVDRAEQAPIASAAGADHVLVARGRAFADRVITLTHGMGVDAVFGGVGASTFRASQRVLRTHGTLVIHGPLAPDTATITLSEIPRSTRIAYALTRDHLRREGELRARADELFTRVQSDRVVVRVGRRYALNDAAQARRDIASGAVNGKALLVAPDRLP